MKQPGLFAQHGEDTGWRAPSVLPELDDRYKEIGLDCETDGTDWRGRSLPVGTSVALEDGRAFYLPTRHQGGGNLDPALVRRWLNRELKGKSIAVAEGKFEVHMLRKDGVDLEALGCSLHEIQYRAALLSDTRRSLSLDSLGREFVGRGKKEIARANIWELPASDVGPYAEEDGRLTLDTKKALDIKIAEQGLTRVCQLEDDLIYCVCEMERNGAPLNMPLLEEWKNETQKRYTDAIMDTWKATGLRVNPNKSQDLAKLFKQLGLDYGQTETGLPSFTDAFLKTIHEPNVERMRFARAIDSLRSKYILPYWKIGVETGGSLYYKLHQLKGDEYGTISGRFSSSTKNIQQVFSASRQRKKFGFDDFIIRTLFVPRPGRLWVKADAKQIEFRLFVHYSKSEKLLKIYADNPDVDFHDEVKAMVEKFRPIDRDSSKTLNFARLYGAGRDKNAFMLGIARSEADQLFEAYEQAFPEARELMNKVMHLARKRGYVFTILGRRARFPNGERLHSALNRVIQGTAADVMKKKLLQVYNERKRLDFFMYFTVHDEVDGDVGSVAQARELKKILDEPDQELKLRVPILWDVKHGPNWATTSDLGMAA